MGSSRKKSETVQPPLFFPRVTVSFNVKLTTTDRWVIFIWDTVYEQTLTELGSFNWAREPVSREKNILPHVSR